MEELVRKFGNGVEYAVEDIDYCIGTKAMLDETDADLSEEDCTVYRVTSRGYATLQEAKSVRAHSRRELWENRLYGFIVGILIPVVLEWLI